MAGEQVTAHDRSYVAVFHAWQRFSYRRRRNRVVWAACEFGRSAFVPPVVQ